MGFFEDVDAIGIAELNAKRILEMEDEEGERVIETFRNVRTELRQRLAKWNGSRLRERFTAQRLRGTLLQIEEALAAWEGPLAEAMTGSAERASIFSIESLQDELRAYDQFYLGATVPINLDAMRIASEQHNLLINQYSVSFLKWTDQTRGMIQQGLIEALAREDTNEQVIARLLKHFLGYEWQLRRIVRTEMHSIYNTSKIRGMQEARGRFMPDLMKCLFHPMDHRTAEDSKLLAKMNPIIPINKPFRYTYMPGGSKKQYYREFMAPPDRPNDRAVLIPYRASWQAENADQTLTQS